MVFLDEQLTVYKLTAAALIFTGVHLANNQEKKG
jgi:hypothetical protein